MTKHRELTPEDVARYMTKGGCPFCGSANINEGSFCARIATAWQELDCTACGAKWTDDYGLVGISVDNVELRLPDALQGINLQAVLKLVEACQVGVRGGQFHETDCIHTLRRRLTDIATAARSALAEAGI